MYHVQNIILSRRQTRVADKFQRAETPCQTDYNCRHLWGPGASLYRGEWAGEAGGTGGEMGKRGRGQGPRWGRGREGGSESWEEVVVFAVLEGCEYWIQFVCVA